MLQESRCLPEVPRAIRWTPRTAQPRRLDDRVFPQLDRPAADLQIV